MKPIRLAPKAHGVLLSLLLCLPSGAQVWTSVGPSPIASERKNPAGLYSGRVAALAVDPADPGHWLMGAGNSGVWESRDSGASWLPVADDAPTLAIGAVAFAPSDPTIVYAATGEATLPGVTKAGMGILKSIDSGTTWTLLAASSFARASVRRVRVHPTNPDIVMAATSRGGYGRDSHEGVPSAPPFGVLRSTDGGATWIRTLAGQATALEIDSTEFNNQYAAIADQRAGVRIEGDSPGSVPNGVYRSSDGGRTWALVAGPWGASTLTSATVGRIELAMAPSNPNVLYASIAVPPNGGSNALPLLGLYRTGNAWAATPAWIQVSIAATGNSGYCGPEKCNYSHVISVDPSEPNTLFAGGAEEGFWRCSNCGQSPVWTNTTTNKGVHGDYHALAWAEKRLIVGNDGGVWSTANLGTSWQNHNATLPTLMFFSGALHPTDPNFILGGLRDNGVAIRTIDNLWGFTALPGTVSGTRELGEAEVAISASRPDNDWMAAWIWGVVGRTTDGGKTWIGADAGIDTTGSAFVAPVRKCPGADDVFLTGSNRMWRTDNFFSSPAPAWAPNGPVHPAPFPNSLAYPGTILTIGFAESDTTCNTYAFGNRGGQIQLTRDGGKTWTDLTAAGTLPARPVNGLAFDPSNANILYIGLSSFNDATPGKPGHVFKTTNALSASPSWMNVSPALDQPFNAIAIDPADPRIVYAGSDNGLFRSTDGASTWVRMGPETGLPNASIYDVKINPDTNRTVVFTYGRGAYALDVSPTGLPPY